MSKIETELELEFIEDFMDEVIGPCPCPNPDCEVISFKKKGKSINYIVDFDPKATELETNVIIQADVSPAEKQKVNPLVFNGKCRSNMDFAKVLHMVII